MNSNKTGGIEQLQSSMVKNLKKQQVDDTSELRRTYILPARIPRKLKEEIKLEEKVEYIYKEEKERNKRRRE